MLTWRRHIVSAAVVRLARDHSVHRPERLAKIPYIESKLTLGTIYGTVITGRRFCPDPIVGHVEG